MTEPVPLTQRAAERPQNLRPSEAVHRLDVLEKAPLFFALGDAALRAFARRLRPVHLEPGERLLSAGDLGDSVYLVDFGRIRLLDEGLTIGDIVPGGICGEAALAGEREPHDAVAMRRTQLFALDATLAEQLLATDSVLEREARRLSRQRTLAGARPRPASGGVRLTVGVMSAKGGSGTTTLAVNLAAALAATGNGEVGILDLALPYCDAALLATTTPAGSLAAISRGAGDDLRERVLAILVRHPAGFAVLPAALRPEEAEIVTPELAAAALRILERELPLVVVDLGSRLSDIEVDVLERCDEVVVVMPAEIAAVKDTARLLAVLEDVLGIPRGRITLLLNDRLDHGPVTPSAAAQALDTDIDLVIDFDGSRPERTALEGSLSALADPRGAVARAVGPLARRLLQRAAGGGRVTKED